MGVVFSKLQALKAFCELITDLLGWSFSVEMLLVLQKRPASIYTAKPGLVLSINPDDVLLAKCNLVFIYNKS